MNCLLTVTATLVLTSFGAKPDATPGATSEQSRTFTVNMEHGPLVKWYEANRLEIMAASNCKVLKELGQGTYRVQTMTPIGACIYVLKETRQDDQTEDGRPRTVYQISYVRNESGRVGNQQLQIALVEREGKTEVTMSMTTTVNGRYVPVMAVTSVQKKSLSGSERFIAESVRSKGMGE